MMTMSTKEEPAMTTEQPAAGRFAGKVAIVTGTGVGQGRDAALRLVAEGAHVVGAELDQAAGEETARQVRAAGGRYVGVNGVDLTNEADVASVVAAAVAEFGRVDLLYNNAAGARMAPGLTMDRDDFDFTITGTTVIPWLMTKHAAPALAESGGGAIVNIASISGSVGTGLVGNAPFLVAYGTAKAALVRLTQALAVELAPFGVRMNAVSPGIIATAATAPILGEEGSRLRDWHMDHLLIKRPGTPADVVSAATFLLSDEASYITGQNLIVDGGWAASGGRGTADPDVVEELSRSFAAADAAA
jgi:meso-butanediol dehydrogenase/(S,S)-butanediol dehydrogenase/diacetyl reductase